VGEPLGGPVILVPFAVGDPAFDEHLATLAQIFPTALGSFVEGHDVVPVGGLVVAPTGVGGDPKLGHRFAALGVAHLWVGSEPSNQQHFVQTHGSSSSQQERDIGATRRAARPSPQLTGCSLPCSFAGGWSIRWYIV